MICVLAICILANNYWLSVIFRDDGMVLLKNSHIRAEKWAIGNGSGFLQPWGCQITKLRKNYQKLLTILINLFFYLQSFFKFFFNEWLPKSDFKFFCNDYRQRSGQIWQVCRSNPSSGYHRQIQTVSEF